MGYADDTAYEQEVLAIVNTSSIVSKCTMGYADDTAYAQGDLTIINTSSYTL